MKYSHMAGEVMVPHAVVHTKNKIVKYYPDGSMKVLHESYWLDSLEYNDVLNKSQLIVGEGDSGRNNTLRNRKYGNGITF